MHKYKWAMTRLDKKGHITNSACTLPHKNLTQDCMKLDLHLSLERVRMLYDAFRRIQLGNQSGQKYVLTK